MNFQDLDIKELTITAPEGPSWKNARMSISQDQYSRIEAIVESLCFPEPDFGPPQNLIAEMSGVKVTIPRTWVYKKNSSIPSNRTSAFLAVSSAVIENTTMAEPDEYTVRFSFAGLLSFDLSRTCQQFNIGGREWHFSSLFDYGTTQKLLDQHGQCAITAILETRKVNKGDLPDVRESAQRIQWLLAFALGCIISVPRTEYLASTGEIVKIDICEAPLDPRSGLCPIPICLPNPGLLTQYLTVTYDNFVKWETKLVLRNVIHTSLFAKAESVINLKALLAANILEILRFNFGHNELVATGRATAQGDDIIPIGGGKRMSFVDILTELSNDHNLTMWQPTPFKTLRNKIVHSGEVEGATLRDRIDNTMALLHFIDVVILGLLEWDKCGGKYIPCNNPSLTGPHVFGNNIIPFVR